jgi:hypothetical protein
MSKAPTVKSLLTELQQLARRRPAEDFVPVCSGTVPDDLQTEKVKALSLDASEHRVLTQLCGLLADDLAFEYLKEKTIKDLTWRFICQATLQTGDCVSSFLTEHRRLPAEHTCFFPVEHLKVDYEVELVGARLLPADAIELPVPFLGPDPGAMQSIIAVKALGTSYNKMTARASEAASRALRILRVALRAHNWVPDNQLRFSLGTAAWFDDGASGWKGAPGQAWDLTLDKELVTLASSQAVASLPVVPGTDVEHRADLALQWFERAQLSVEPNLELLFLFFALETILGDKSEGLKAPALALRRAMLGLLVTGHFAHPKRINLLYDEIRSTAVHGEEAPDVTKDELNRFSWDVRAAIDEFLTLAARLGTTKRSRVRKALDTDPRRQGVVDALLEEDPKRWKRYLAPDLA